MPSFEILADVFTCIFVFDSSKDSLNTFKTCENISQYFKIKHLIIYGDDTFLLTLFLHFNSQEVNKGYRSSVDLITLKGFYTASASIAKLPISLPMSLQGKGDLISKAEKSLSNHFEVRKSSVT